MPRLISARSVLGVQDLDVSTSFFHEKLGFEICATYDGWCFLSRGGFTVMLGHCPDEVPASKIGDHSYFAYVVVDSVDSLCHEFRSRAVQPMSEPESKPWGMREFLVTTPDGHRIMFGQDIDPPEKAEG
ncbi:MAG: VOC family protein [Rhodanobacteraceae bacterium]|nr:VOC family protein [Rhodanobacteraceae bacterium]